MNRINIRIGKPKLSGYMFGDASYDSRVGDIILTRTSLRPTNLFIPGEWSHVLMLGYGTEVVEATLPCVRVSTLIDVWTSTSQVMIVRPINTTMYQRARAYEKAIAFVGWPYDTEFQSTNKSFYCSELVNKAYAMAGVKLGVSRRSIAGGDTVIPSAFDNPDKFEVIFDSRRYKND